MSTRTFKELNDLISHATSINDAAALEAYATELEEIGTTKALAVASSARGSAELHYGNNPQSLIHYQRSLELLGVLGHSSGVANVTGKIGNVYLKMGNYAEALDHFHRALAFHIEHGNRNDVAVVTENLGSAHAATGDFATALQHYHRALAEHIELGNRNPMATVYGNIGLIFSTLGDYPTALEHLHRALDIHEEVNDRPGVARTSNNIGNVYSAAGNLDAAMEHQQKALALNQAHGFLRGEAFSTGSIGTIHLESGNIELALEFFRRAVDLHSAVGNPRGVFVSTGYLISALLQSGALPDAIKMLTVMDDLKADNPVAAVYREMLRARIQALQEHFSTAIQTLSSALEIARKNALPREQAVIHKEMRELALKQSDLAGYVEHNGEYTRIIEEINGKETAAKLATQEAERKMAKERNEHEKHLAILHSTLPKHIADRVARGEQVNDHHDNAAVIFLDIVGFTTISDQLSSSEVVQLLDTVFTTLDAVCKKHDVVKIKTIGDSYMAVAFEAASSEQRVASSEQRIASSEQRAANAALDMLTAVSHILPDLPSGLLENLLEGLFSDLPSGLQVRIGLHCGAVTAGVIGTERMQYDVWGDTVNVASRMESTSAPGRIHVSEAFANALKGEMAKGRNGEKDRSLFPVPCSLIPRGELEIKGKGMMTTYWLEGPLP